MNKINKLKAGLVRVTEHVLEKVKELNDKMKMREDERVNYDHYRNKLAKMEKEGVERSADEEK